MKGFARPHFRTSRRLAGLLVGLTAVAACTTRKGSDYENRRESQTRAHDTRASENDVPAPAGGVDAKRADAILKTSCGGAACHGPGKGVPVYVGDADKVKADARKIAARVSDGTMPVPGTGKTLTAADKKDLLAYVSAVGGTDKAPEEPKLDNKGVATGDVDVKKGRPGQCPSVADVGTPAAPLDFAKDVNPILVASCAGGTCHSQGAQGRQIFVGDEARFKALADGHLIHLRNGSMPLAPKTLDAAGRRILIQALCPPTP